MNEITLECIIWQDRPRGVSFPSFSLFEFPTHPHSALCWALRLDCLQLQSFVPLLRSWTRLEPADCAPSFIPPRTC